MILLCKPYAYCLPSTCRVAHLLGFYMEVRRGEKEGRKEDGEIEMRGGKREKRRERIREKERE